MPFINFSALVETENDEFDRLTNLNGEVFIDISEDSGTRRNDPYQNTGYQ